MGLEARLARLESKVRPAHVALGQEFGFDQLLAKLRLDPATVRELARDRGSSPAEVTAELCGMDFREFKRRIFEAASIGREATWR